MARRLSGSGNEKNGLVLQFQTQSYLYEDHKRSRSLHEQLSSFLGEDIFTDITVIVDDTKHRCHRVVLAASSPYFKALFTYDRSNINADAEIVVSGISSKGFSAMLNLIYTGKLEIRTDNAIDILEAADFLHYREVVEVCNRLLLMHINTYNALALQQLWEAHLYKAEADTAKTYILQKFSQIANTPEFLYLPYDLLNEYLNEKYLHIQDERKLYKSLEAWINFDGTSRMQYRDHLRSMVRLSADGKPRDSPRAGPREQGTPLKGTPRKKCSSVTSGQDDGDRFVPVVLNVPRDTGDREEVQKHYILYYQPHKQQWKVMTKLPFVFRSMYSVAVLFNDVYIIGGESHNKIVHGDAGHGVAVREVTKYSIECNMWSDVTSMLRPRSHPSATSVLSKIYVIGGSGENWDLHTDGEVYDSSTKQWTLLPQLLEVGGLGGCCVVPSGGRIYILGGTEAIYENNQPHAKRPHINMQYYDISKGCWFRVPWATSALEANKMSVYEGDCLPYNGFILIVNEKLTGNSIKIYNPITHDISDFLPLSPGHHFGGNAITGDVLYRTGGIARGLRANDMVDSRSLLDVRIHWKNLPALPFEMAHHASVVVHVQSSKC